MEYDSLEPSFTSPEPLAASGGNIDSLCQTYFSDIDFYSQDQYYHPQKNMEPNNWRAAADLVAETYEDYGASSSYYDVNDWKLSDEALHDLEPYLPEEEAWSAKQEDSYDTLTYDASDWDLPLQNMDNLALYDEPTVELQESMQPALHSPPESVCHFNGDQTPDGEAQALQRHPDVLEKIPSKRKRVRGPKNWEFLIRLLADKRTNPSLIRWEDESKATFRLVQPDKIAQMWSSRTPDSPPLTYNNFARGLRYHYNRGALRPVSEKQLVYQCGPKALQFLIDLRKAAS
ncbi:ETS-related transcription factor Elf-1-like [Penaeus japonicus]|uniref:ETS-related transcription factor Elf-1-like n=1 Tax=Penaeus japonicus TaxID=27405 RepID=UPI001C7171FC|nr:ETS-related transcription factor Elf-1-like [Penaeus japonicus]